jgi:hypothetical protein
MHGMPLQNGFWLRAFGAARARQKLPYGEKSHAPA